MIFSNLAYDRLRYDSEVEKFLCVAYFLVYSLYDNTRSENDNRYKIQQFRYFFLFLC